MSLKFMLLDKPLLKLSLEKLPMKLKKKHLDKNSLNMIDI